MLELFIVLCLRNIQETCPTTRVLSPAGARDYSLSYRVPTDVAVRPTPYLMFVGGFLPGLIGRGVNLCTYLHLVSRLRKTGVVPPLRHVFTTWCFVKHQG